MLKSFKTKTLMLLLAILAGGSITALADEVTDTYVFTTKDWNATLDGEAANWTCNKAGGNYGNNGVQVTTSASGANATSPVSFTDISKIVVTYNTNKSAGAGTLVVKIGENDAKTNEVGYAGSGDGRNANYTSEFTYDTPQTGGVTLTVNTTTNSIYVCSIAITHSGTGTTPPPAATYTVTYDCNGGTSGCPSNLTNVAKGTVIQLADAPIKDGFTFNGWNDGSNNYDEGDDYTVNSNVTFTAQWTENVEPGDATWVQTSLADLTADDVFVIVGNNGSNYAMSNDKGASYAPTAVAVTVANGALTSTVAANIQWTLSVDDGGYTFYPNGSTETWLYCTNANNGVRVGTGDDNTFSVKDDYLYNEGQSRYIGIYNSQDWRSYTTINNNIKDQTFAFYKKVTGGEVPPSITAENVEIDYIFFSDVVNRPNENH